jgi:LPS O-antigen subunit length determinant protein (WzzB/FepE family)
MKSEDPLDMRENGGDLIEYLEILWKRRWLIIVPTVLIALIAGVISFLIRPQWEVDAIIQPSRFFVQSAQGTLTEVVVIDPRQLAGQINQGSYNRQICANLSLDPRRFPKLTAINLRDTKLVRVSLRTGEGDKAPPILNALFEQIKSELDRKIDVEIKSISTQISSKENDIKARGFDVQSKNIEIETTRQEIIAAGNKLKISEDRFRGLTEQMKSVQVRIEEIEKQQRSMLAEKQSGIDSLGLLLYANEVQQNFRYYNTLEESLSAERNRQEDLRLSLREKGLVIKSIQTQIGKFNQEIIGLQSDIELLEEKKQRIDYAQLVKEPTVSLNPVYPKKRANVAMAGILAFFSFSILALVLGSVEKRGARPGSGA